LLRQHDAKRAQLDAGRGCVSPHFAISSVQNIGLAVRTVLTQHMHRDAEDILNNRGRGSGSHGTYNVAWYKCTCSSPLSDDAVDIFRTVFSDNRCVYLTCLRTTFAPCDSDRFSSRDAFNCCRCFVVRLSNAYHQQKFLYTGGFIAPWAMAGTFGITTDSHVSDGSYLLVLTAPLLEWQTSQSTHAQAAASAVSSNSRSDQSTAVDAKRARFADEAFQSC
jgi:hypothetical protein